MRHSHFNWRLNPVIERRHCPCYIQYSQSATGEHHSVCWMTRYRRLHLGLSVTVYSLGLRCTTADEALPEFSPKGVESQEKAENSTVYKTLLHWHIWHKRYFLKVKTIWIWIPCINSFKFIEINVKKKKNPQSLCGKKKIQFKTKKLLKVIKWILLKAWPWLGFMLWLLSS